MGVPSRPMIGPAGASWCAPAMVRTRACYERHGIIAAGSLGGYDVAGHVVQTGRYTLRR
jgi:hypothetical protein